ncbi:MAG: uracil-DNA glycosylase [Pseudomonadota bacterium]
MPETGAGPGRPAPPQGQGDPAASTPAALAAGADTLDALAEAMRGYDGSDLKAGAKNFCFADGNPAARLMVIGEAPGAEEDRAGKPFVGRAGRLLDLMLGAIDLDRYAEDPEKSAYITNLLPWRPPGNRTPSTAEARMYLPFLERHIALKAPRAILCLGNPATQALLATSTGIKRMRGHWVRHRATGIPLLPSFHPAYLLRQPADKRLTWRDLLSVRAVLDGEEPGL